MYMYFLHCFRNKWILALASQETSMPNKEEKGACGSRRHTSVPYGNSGLLIRAHPADQIHHTTLGGGTPHP